MDEIDIMSIWFNHLRAKGYQQVGSLKQTKMYEVSKIDNFSNNDKHPGALLKSGNTQKLEDQWNVYFYYNERGLTINDYVRACQAHPLFSHGCKQKEKQVEEFKDGKTIFHDHLSFYDFGFRTKLNFSAIMGYTKHGDTKDDNGQMTHFYMRMTSGRNTKENSILQGAIRQADS